MEIPFVNRHTPTMDRLYLEDIEIPYLKEQQRITRLLAKIARIKQGVLQPRTREIKFWERIKTRIIMEKK